jgi:hypothetical protein
MESKIHAMEQIFPTMPDKRRSVDAVLPRGAVGPIGPSTMADWRVP